MRTNKYIPFLIALSIHALFFIPLIVNQNKLSLVPNYAHSDLQNTAIELNTFKMNQKGKPSPSKTIKNSSPINQSELESNKPAGQSLNKIENKTENQNSSEIHFIQFSEPTYPPVSRANGEEGVVKMRIHFNENGQITNSELIQSSGKPLLDQSAQKSILSWKLNPSKSGGVFEKSFVFKLKN